MLRDRALVILSGGLDSTVLLHHLRTLDVDVEAISFDYGQRHARELGAARATCAIYGVRHDVVDLRAIGALLAISGSSLLPGSGVPVPEGHYADESMKKTVVPNRNMIMLSIAAGVAIARGMPSVAYGAHAGDHAIYPDCRPAFADAVGVAFALADWAPLELRRPFVHLTKAQIVTIGAQIGVAFEDTWSCYQGGDVHCGACGTCVERREAFALAGVRDPTPYLATPTIGHAAPVVG